MAAISNMPIDPLRPLEVIVREVQRQRHSEQNSYYWLRLNEIAEQAWLDGRQFCAETWHEYFKRSLLVEDLPAPEPGTVRDGYRKWDYDPSGERVLIGSTTMLTIRGFAAYTEAVEAFGCSLGVEFSANPMEGKP